MAERQGWLKLARAFGGWWLTPWRFAYEEETGTVVLSDMHLGAEVSLARQGMYLPDMSSKGILRVWEKVVGTGPTRIVIAGDLFDAAAPDVGAVRLFGELLQMAPPACEVILTPGNHDPEEAWLRDMFERMRIEAAVEVGGVTVTHGHLMPAAVKGTTGALFVGHQHPAVRVATRVQKAKMICFAECMCGGGGEAREVVLLPAFSPLPLGSNLLTGRHWIVDMEAPRPQEVRVYGIVKEQVLDFGELAGLGGTGM
jgi:putative SbcD/Mre11-related phosphoesterase